MENKMDKKQNSTDAERSKLVAQLIDLRRDSHMTRIYAVFSIPDHNRHPEEKIIFKK